MAAGQDEFEARLNAMKLPRRKFLGSSVLALSSQLMDALTTPLWRWKCPLLLDSKVPSGPEQVQFVDVAKESGLNVPNVWGSGTNKQYIIEAKGSGLAFFDYDNDGWLDVYLTNGMRLGEKWPENAPTTHFIRTTVTEHLPT